MIKPRFVWRNRHLYIQIQTEGFIGEHRAISPVIQAEGLYKAVCGLALAMGIFDIGYASGLTVPDDYSFSIHRSDGRAWLLHGVHEPDPDVLATLRRLVPNGSLPSHAAAAQIFQIMMALKHEEKGARILLAAQWLFDSYLGRNDLLSFVQSMVVLEILLGDDTPPEEIGLGQLLRNRCAFLIGKSHEERAAILRDFVKIYQVRSQIVHRGKSQLSVEERSLFSKLQWICNRVVQAEIRLLRADNAVAIPTE